MWQTYLSQSHRTCWGPSVDLLQSGISWDRSPGPPGPRCSESSQQHRPPSCTRWAVTAGTDAGNCRTAAAGSAGSWRIVEGNKFKETVTHCFHYVSVAVCQSSYDYWSVRLFLTFLKTSGGLSSAQWSAGHCSGWRKGSLGAALVALSCKRHTHRLKKWLIGHSWLLLCSKSNKWAYISSEFACSFCLSQTNSLYLLLTLEIFLVKHTLSV